MVILDKHGNLLSVENIIAFERDPDELLILCNALFDELQKAPKLVELPADFEPEETPEEEECTLCGIDCICDDVLDEPDCISDDDTEEIQQGGEKP